MNGCTINHGHQSGCTNHHGHQSGCTNPHESQQDLDEQLEELAGQQGFKFNHF
jgi:hypothetical protein